VTGTFLTFKSKISSKEYGATVYKWKMISVRPAVFELAGLVLPADHVLDTPDIL
jgi:hypothetical protein